MTEDVFNFKRATILWQTLKKEKSLSVKTVEEDAEQLVVQETAVATKSQGKAKSGSNPLGKTPLPTVTDLTAASKSGQEVLPTVNEDVENIIAVREGRKANAPAVTKKSERRVANFKRYVTDDVERAVGSALHTFGLTLEQDEVIGQSVGRYFGATERAVTTALSKQAQETAGELLSRIQKAWDAATPAGHSRDEALKAAWTRVQAKLKANPKGNVGDYVREVLFTPWRKRFMDRLAADSEFKSLLKSATAMQIEVTKAGTPRFGLQLKMGNRRVTLRFDVDHAETQLADAAKSAKGPSDLLPVIDSNRLQLLTSADNRVQIRILRDEADAWSQAAAEALKTAPKRPDARSIQDELRRDIDDMLQVLDRPGVTWTDIETPVNIPTGEDWVSGH
jgi:hypothetical protein